MKDFITRKINREYNALLLAGAEVGQDWAFKISANNAEIANDYLVKAMSWKTQEEIDEMRVDDFNKLLEQINIAWITAPSESSDKKS